MIFHQAPRPSRNLLRFYIQQTRIFHRRRFLEEEYRVGRARRI